jgi:predicted nucleic acid-binding protein
LECRVILVDSNVWIDVIQRDEVWLDWSLTQLQKAREADTLAINPVIYAELVPNYNTPGELAQFVTVSGVEFTNLSPAASYAAGRAFERYRKRGGKKTGVVADFFIGGQAITEGCTLLTRDAARYKSYFPKIRLVSP